MYFTPHVYPVLSQVIFISNYFSIDATHSSQLGRYVYHFLSSSNADFLH